MPVIEITSLEHPGVDVFGTLTEAQLRNRIDPEKGIFIAESPKVIRVALDAGYQPLALLCEKKHIEGDNHLAVLFFSTRTTFSRFSSLFCSILNHFYEENTLATVYNAVLYVIFHMFMFLLLQ